AEGVIALVQRIMHRDGENLLVEPLLIAHAEHTDRSHDNEASGEGRHGDHHEHVERISVVGESAREETVVTGVIHGTVEQPVALEVTGLLVELVLVAAAARSPDGRIQLVRGARPARETMPGTMTRS